MLKKIRRLIGRVINNVSIGRTKKHSRALRQVSPPPSPFFFMPPAPPSSPTHESEGSLATENHGHRCTGEELTSRRQRTSLTILPRLSTDLMQCTR